MELYTYKALSQGWSADPGVIAVRATSHVIWQPGVTSHVPMDCRLQTLDGHWHYLNCAKAPNKPRSLDC